MDKCTAKWFVLNNPEHGRDHSDLIITESMDVFYYRRQDGRYQLMMEFKSSTFPDKFTYKQYIGDVNKEEFDNNFNCFN